MKNFQKMSRKDLTFFCLMSVLAGVMIGMAGTASLISNNLLGKSGRAMGAILFSLGIFVIITYGMRLFTGMVSELPKLGVKNYWQLAVCFLCNAIGVLIVAVLVYHTHLKDIVVPQAQAVIAPKLGADKWAISSFCSSILCGILITVSVWSANHAPRKALSASVGVIFPIIMFAFCGFDHSVANMLYFFYLKEFSWRVIGYVLLSIVGNIIGGLVLPLVMQIKENDNKNQ